MSGDRNFADGLEDYAGHSEYQAAAEERERREREQREENRRMMGLHSSDRGDK